MTRRLACVVREHFTVLLANCDEELVDGHGSVDSNFSSKQGFYFMLFDSIGCVFLEQSCETFDTHGGDESGWTQCDDSHRA